MNDARPGHGQPEDGRHARPAAPAGRAGRSTPRRDAGPLRSRRGGQPGRAPARGLAPRRTGPVVGVAGDATFALDAVVAAVQGQPRGRQRGAAVPGRPRRPPSSSRCTTGPTGAEVVLTRRSAVAAQPPRGDQLPRRAAGRGETPEHAALREADEEVALAPDTVELVGRLPPLATVVSLSHIVPGRRPAAGPSRTATGGGRGRAHPPRATAGAGRPGGLPRGVVG